MHLLATRQAYALRRAIRRNGELSMFEQQQPFANLRRVMASILTMTIALGPTVVPAFASSGKQESRHATSATATPIQHLVVIFNENISFDHYFGTYPNALNPEGEPKFKASDKTPTVNGLTNALLNSNPNLNPANGTGAANPFRLDRSQAFTNDMDHDYLAEQQASDAGLMDLFPLYTGTAGPPPSGTGVTQTNGLVMGYFDGNTVTALWNYAHRRSV
jgi:phospholipase C